MPKIYWVVLQISILLILAAAVMDDYPQAATSLYYIPIGSYISGSIETGSDQDWFKVYVISGRTYTFASDGTATSLDTQIYIYDSTGSTTQYGTSDDYSGLNALYTWTATITGTVIFKAATYTGTGAYKAYVIESTSTGCSSECASSSNFLRKNFLISQSRLYNNKWGFELFPDFLSLQHVFEQQTCIRSSLRGFLSSIPYK